MEGKGRRRGRLGTAIGALCVVLAGVPAPAADGVARVRGVDPRSQALIVLAAKRSPTVAALIRNLERDDIVVMVQVTFVPQSLSGDLRMIASTPTCRYLLLRVDVTRSREEQIEHLGHELQHATEVAGATDVQDEAALARLMERIGQNTGRGQYETEAAVRVGRTVRAELRQKSH